MRYFSRPFRHFQPLLVALSALLLTACASVPQPDIIQIPSPNHGERRPNFVILHDTASDRVERALRTLTNPARQVSAHYLIARDGRVFQLVDESRRAWHAGQSYWGGNTDLNSASIGIELDNRGDEPYPEIQLTRLLDLLSDLQERYRIPASNVLGHGDIAPRRKVDPGIRFPWQRLAEAGFGRWCFETPPASFDAPLAPKLPDAQLALRALGYDMLDPTASLRAFRRHFTRSLDDSPEASDSERWLMHCLLRSTGEKMENPAVATPEGDAQR
jgi:N-acetylmuramoyl-L-alanine amidase